MKFRAVFIFPFVVAVFTACMPLFPPAATATKTPIIFATPFAFDASTQNISEEIDIYYNSTRGSCDEIRHLDFSPHKSRLVFNEASHQINFDDVEIQWIADNVDGSYRAYILSEYFCAEANTDCRKNIVYWQNNINGKSYKIEWNNQEIYLYRSVFWIGKNILVIREVAFPGSFIVKGVDVDMQTVIYLGVVDNCK